MGRYDGKSLGKLSSESFNFFSRVESVATKMGEKMWEFEGKGEQMKKSPEEESQWTREV